MKNSIVDIYYRGRLDFCNYSCYYCPFSKNKYDKNTIKEDKVYLDRFYDFIIENPNIENILFIPYGEILIHDYYIEYISKISRLGNIQNIGIQTNNSFSTNRLLEIFESEKGNIEKLNLWCSYHPYEVEEDIFIDKILELRKNKIKFSVGTVGNPKMKDKLYNFRKKIPDDIYLWINEMDGRKKEYEKDDIDYFKFIDPYFQLELNKPMANITKCYGGKTRLFINYKLIMQPCNISRTVVKDNISCKSKKCDCYLAYSNRDDIKILKRYKNRGLFRNLNSIKTEILFFDVDNTLIDTQGMNAKVKDILVKLKENKILFLNTSLPFEIAIKRLGANIELFSGGIFSNGANIKFFDYDYNLEFLIDDKVINNILNNKNIKKFLDIKDKKIYKIIFFYREFIEKISEEERKILNKIYNISKDNKFVYINNIFSNKEKGIEIVKRFYLSDVNKITFFGDSENDILTNSKIKMIKIEKDLEKKLLEIYNL